MNTPAKVLNAPNHTWKIAESLDLYQVEAWGKGYFSINAQGHVVIRPNLDAMWFKVSRHATCTRPW